MQKTWKNDWNPGKWVLIREYSARAIQWIPTWQGLDGFKILCFLLLWTKVALALEGLIVGYSLEELWYMVLICRKYFSYVSFYVKCFHHSWQWYPQICFDSFHFSLFTYLLHPTLIFTYPSLFPWIPSSLSIFSPNPPPPPPYQYSPPPPPPLPPLVLIRPW